MAEKKEVFSPAAAGVGLSEDFVAAVHRQLAPKLRLLLWLLADLTRSVDLPAGFRIVLAQVDDAIRHTAQGQGVTEAMLPAVRRCVLQALMEMEGVKLGPPGAADRWGEISPLADAGRPPPAAAGCAGE